MNFEESIDLILKKEKKPISLSRLCEKIIAFKRLENEDFELSKEDQDIILQILEEKVKSFDYFKNDNDQYILLCKTPYRVGRLSFVGNEAVVFSFSSYVDSDGKQVVLEKNFSISKENCRGAIDGDFVLVDTSLSLSVKVEKVLERNIGDVMGEVTRLGSHFFLYPYDSKYQNLTIALEGDFIEGEVVLASLKKTESDNYYIGNVLKTFHHKDDPHKEALITAFSCGMPYGFSEDSLKQVKEIPFHVSLKQKEGRYDFTEWEIFSIDGADTKDKDDCISFMNLSNGNFLLGVHIAHTSFYVPTDSPLHKDAFRKGTSYYFGGAVEPQYPRELSNGICSLNDGVDRLCKSILMEYDQHGNLVDRMLVPSVIHSRIGMTYDKVNQILKEGIVDCEYEDYADTLKNMAVFAKKLRKKRLLQGAIEFCRPENKFLYDEFGNAIDSNYYYPDVSEHLIEEFMLAANVNVAEILENEGIPVIYRVHGSPNKEKLKEFLALLDAIGIGFGYSAEEICGDKHLMQLLTFHINEKAGVLKDMLNMNLIRCMSHAFYSPENIGHYGTAFKTYCHFTSPIRRLADDTNDRIITDCYFEKDSIKKAKAISNWKKKASDYANQASKMERIQEEVEKSVSKLDTITFLSHQVGEEFEGIVISVHRRGLTVQLDKVQVDIDINTIPGEYVYNPKTFTLLSLEEDDSYYLGDRLRIKLTSVDIDERVTNFSILEKVQENVIFENHRSNQLIKRRMEHKKSKKERDIF